MSTFEDSITEKLSVQLQELEEKRLLALADQVKATRACMKIMISAVILGIIIYAVSQNHIPLFVIVVLGAIFSMFAYSSICGQSVAAFESSYKNQLIRGVAKSLQPDMEYYPDQGISEELFSSCGHYNTGIDRYSTEDLFQGKIGDTELLFGELHAEYKTTSTDSKGRTTTHWHTIFRGVLFMADFHKHFDTWVTVNPDNESGGFFGWVGKKIQGLSSSLVKMENPDFEQHFVVNAGDVTGAMYILTPDMQERILSLRESLGDDIIISFQNSNVFITAPKYEDWFEPDINVSAYSKEQMHNIGSQIAHYFRIVETLNLNTRIWTKE